MLRVESLAGQADIRQVALGNQHSLFLDAQGIVYSCGDNKQVSKTGRGILPFPQSMEALNLDEGFLKAAATPICFSILLNLEMNRVNAALVLLWRTLQSSSDKSGSG